MISPKRNQSNKKPHLYYENGKWLCWSGICYTWGSTPRAAYDKMVPYPVNPVKANTLLERDAACNPCVGVCSTTTGDAVCRGCGRTVDEIRDWNSYTRPGKLLVKSRLAARLLAHYGELK